MKPGLYVCCEFGQQSPLGLEVVGDYLAQAQFILEILKAEICASTYDMYVLQVHSIWELQAFLAFCHCHRMKSSQWYIA